MSKKLFIFFILGAGLLALPTVVSAYDINCGGGDVCVDGFCQGSGDFICSCPGDEIPSCSGGGPEACEYAVVCWNGPNGCSCSAPDPTPTPAPQCFSGADCDDGNSCTSDICESDGTCSNPSNGSCNAPSPSPSPEAVCSQHSDCDDGIACTVDICQITNCAHFGGPCSCGDGSCTGGEDASNCPADCASSSPLPSPSPTPTPSPSPSPTPSPSPSPSPTPTPQCSDVIDNDGDGLTDWPADPGCVNAADGDEFNVPPNNAPLASNVTLTEPDYCTVGPSGTVTWSFSDPDVGDTQSAFRVQVDDDPAFGSPAVDTGKIISSATSHFVGQGALNFNTIYRTRVLVWDDHDLQCVTWVPQSACQGPGCQPGDTSWRTPIHRYPSGIGINILPPNPQINEVIQFTGIGQCFDNSNNPTSCLNWLWDFGDGDTAATQNPTHAYGTTGVHQTTLQVEDAQNQICPVVPVAKTINIRARLPKWREVLPR